MSAAKKRWLSSSYKELNRKTKKKSEEEIVWTSSSSSESDDNSKFEPNSSRLNKIKPTVEEAHSSWIQVPNDYCTPPPEISNTDESNKVATQIVISSESPDLHSKTTKVAPILAQVEESPIIDRFLGIEDNSPVLNRIPSFLMNELSPIIGRKRRKIRRPFKDEEDIVVEECGDKVKITDDDDDLFSSSTQTCNIIETLELSLSQRITQISQSCIIDPFPSQQSSEVIQIGSLSSAPSSELSEFIQLSEGSSTGKRRKRFKKGGLASQLQRALTNYRTKLAIRDHEMYKNKGDVELLSLEDEIIKFKILEKWTEFECHICRCIQLGSDKDILVIIGFNLDISVINLVLNDNFYTALPPYKNKIVMFREKGIICYYNISKILNI